MNIAIIPARAGSKRSPNKNLQLIHNKTLIELCIEQAIRTNLFDKIIFSSDCDRALSIVKKYKNIAIDRRSNELANDTSPLIAVIQHLSSYFNCSDNDIICLLPVTNPLRRDIDIKNGIQKFKEHQNKFTVVSVVKNTYPIELMWRESNGILSYAIESCLKSTRKQDFLPTYCWNDAFIIDSSSNFSLPTRTLYGTNSCPYYMAAEHSISIDFEWQITVARSLYNYNNIVSTA